MRAQKFVLFTSGQGYGSKAIKPREKYNYKNNHRAYAPKNVRTENSKSYKIYLKDGP